MARRGRQERHRAASILPTPGDHDSPHGRTGKWLAPRINDTVFAFYLVLFALPAALIGLAVGLARWTRPQRGGR
jgi:hypothetical protein